MMVKLKEEEEADVMLLEKIQRGETSEEEIQKEILRLQRQVKAITGRIQLFLVGQHRRSRKTSMFHFFSGL